MPAPLSVRSAHGQSKLQPQSPDTEPLPEVTYSPAPAIRRPVLLARAMIRDLIVARGLGWRLAVRDIKALYRQSLLGYLWAFLPPAIAALTFVLLRQNAVFTTAETPISYGAFVLIGSALWMTFAESLNAPIRVVTTSRALLIKINFPREALVLSGIFTTGVTAAIRLLIILPALFYYRVGFSFSQLLFPLGVVALILLGTAIGLLLTPLGLLYQDVGKSLALVVTFWIFFTPVAYPLATSGLPAQLMRINPVTPLLTATRDWLTAMPTDPLGGFVLVVTLSLLALFVGWLAYRIALPHLIARLGM